MNLLPLATLTLGLVGLNGNALAAQWQCKNTDGRVMLPPQVVWDAQSGVATASFFENPDTRGRVTRMVPHNDGIKVNLEFATTKGFNKGKIQELVIFTGHDEYRMGGVVYAVVNGKRHLDVVIPTVPVTCTSR